jgi:hypothetical protein
VETILIIHKQEQQQQQHQNSIQLCHILQTVTVLLKEGGILSDLLLQINAIHSHVDINPTMEVEMQISMTLHELRWLWQLWHKLQTQAINHLQKQQKLQKPMLSTWPRNNNSSSSNNNNNNNNNTIIQDLRHIRIDEGQDNKLHRTLPWHSHHHHHLERYNQSL